MNFLIVILITTLFLLVVEFLKRKFKFSANVTRKISHIGGAFIAAICPFFLEKNLIIIACLGFAGVMFLSKRISFFSSIHDVNRATLGEVFLPLGEAISAAIFLPTSVIAFQYGILVMGLSDALAGLVGERFGKHKVELFPRKSLEGTLTFFLVTLLLTFIFIPSSGIYLFLVPIFLTLVELILGYGTDNLFIPILASLLFTFLS